LKEVYKYAKYGLPPSQPSEKGAGTHEVTYYSDKDYKVPVVTAYNPSNPAITENAQQDPQIP